MQKKVLVGQTEIVWDGDGLIIRTAPGRQVLNRAAAVFYTVSVLFLLTREISRHQFHFPVFWLLLLLVNALILFGLFSPLSGPIALDRETSTVRRGKVVAPFDEISRIEVEKNGARFVIRIIYPGCTKNELALLTPLSNDYDAMYLANEISQFTGAGVWRTDAQAKVKQTPPEKLPSEIVMAIPYRSRRSDQWRCMRRMYLHPKALRVMLLPPALLMLFYTILEASAVGILGLLARFAIILALYAALYALVIAQSLKRMYPLPNFVRQGFIILNSRGYGDCMPEKSSFFPWSKVARINSTDDDVYFLRRDGSSYFPALAKNDPENAKLLVACATALWKGGPTPPGPLPIELPENLNGVTMPAGTTEVPSRQSEVWPPPPSPVAPWPEQSIEQSQWPQQQQGDSQPPS